jgi:hypothetical protein
MFVDKIGLWDAFISGLGISKSAIVLLDSLSLFVISLPVQAFSGKDKFINSYDCLFV